VRDAAREAREEDAVSVDRSPTPIDRTWVRKGFLVGCFFLQSGGRLIGHPWALDILL
jgi:hypothetical protein